MTSTTSTKNTLSSKLRLTILLCVLPVTLLAVELLTRGMHNRRQITLNIEGGIQQAISIRSNPAQRQILFAGNSLVYEDLSQQQLQQAMGPDYLIHSAGVPGSTYYDWRYGLRALFARGSQPDAVVFGISPSQFLRPPAVTSAPVARLWRNQDALAYWHDERISLTVLSELLLERASTFFALRNTVRIYVRKFIPGYADVDWTPMPASPDQQSKANLELIFKDRLSQLAAECPPQTQLLLMIAPTNQATDAALEPDLQAAAKDVGISVIEPIGETEWPGKNFQRDGYHLTPSAAAEFSKLVAGKLKLELSNPAKQAQDLAQTDHR